MLAETIKLLKGDLSTSALEAAKSTKLACVDIETSGLDFRNASIGSIQIFIADVVYLVRPPYDRAFNIRSLLADEEIKKVFHHAMFDLRFIKYHLGGMQKNIACTKIASKIVAPDISKHSLLDLVQEHFGVKLHKEMRFTDWVSDKLTREQLEYAAGDVIYLSSLLTKLLRSAVKLKRQGLIKKSFDYIPSRVDLDIIGAGDVFLY